MEMQLAHRLAQFAPTDADARMLARHVLVRAKDYIEHARQLRRPLREAGFNVRKLHELTRYVAQEFTSYFQSIRDRLSAHVQDLEFLERIELWNSVDFSKTEFFTEAAIEIYNHLSSLSISEYVPYISFYEIRDDVFGQLLIEYRGSGSKIFAVEMGSDALSLTRPNSSSMISRVPLHARASQLALIHRWIEAQKGLLDRFTEYPNVTRILKARLITDIVSACDCLVTRSIASDAPQRMDGLDVLLTAAEGAQHSIERFKSVYKIDKVVAPLRAVRNQVGGHLDESSDIGLNNILKTLDDISVSSMMRVYTILRSVFEQTARENIILMPYLADGQTIYGVTGVQLGRTIAPFDDKPTPGRVIPLFESIPIDDEALAAKLEEWIAGDDLTRGRARSAFYQAFLNSPVEEKIQSEENFGSSTHYHQHSIRKAHRFLLRVLTNETNVERIHQVLDLMKECASGDPETLAEVLLQYSETPQSLPNRAAIAYCLGDLARWHNLRARNFLEEGLHSKSIIGIMSRTGLLRMFVRSEGLKLINRGQASDTLLNVIGRLTEGYSPPGKLLTEIYLLSQFCDRRISTFERPFSQDHASIHENICYLASSLVDTSEIDSVMKTVKILANNWDYVGISLFLFDKFKGGAHERLGIELVQFSCNNIILAAEHEYSRRHLCGCLQRVERHGEALQLAERLAHANPGNTDLQILHAQTLVNIEARHAEALQRVNEIDTLYVLNGVQRGAVTELKSSLAARPDR